MNSRIRPRRSVAARFLAIVVAVPMALAACSGGGPLGGGGDPASVVKDALAKVAAHDIDGATALVCADKVDEFKNDFDLGSSLADDVPSMDPQDLKDVQNSVTVDTSAITVGTPTINGDTATVPLSGSMKMTFDKDKMRPIIKKMMEAQGGGVTLTDDQIDQFLDAFGGGQSIPVDDTLTLKQENGAWKICGQE